MFDIISIGDATIDTFLLVHDLEIKKINGTQKAVLNWGDKLPVDKFYRTVAGNAANNAIGSARLGLKTAFYTVLADDSGGREILHKMEKEKVSTRYIITNDAHPTNNSVVLSFKGERTIFVYHEHRKYKLPNFVDSAWLYLTSMGVGFEVIYNDMIKYIDRYKVKTGFNPGTFQLRAGVKANQKILERTEVLFLNKEEAQSWVGEIEDYKILCQKLLALGPIMVVLTDGMKGAFSLSKIGFFSTPCFPAKLVDATGAGDAFSTAFMSALFYGLSPGDALSWGAINSAGVVEKIGPQAGLHTKREIELKLSKNKKFKAIKL